MNHSKISTKEIRRALGIPQDAFIRDDNLMQDQSYTSCGSPYEVVLRKATELDKAVILIEKELWKREQKKTQEEELRQLSYLKRKYE